MNDVVGGAETQEDGTATVVMIGDSRAAAWDLPLPKSETVRNWGVNGASAQQVAGLVARQIVDSAPTVAVVQVGVNDLWRIGVFDSAENQRIVDNVFGAIAEINERLTKRGTHVIISTIFPLGRLSTIERVSGSSETPAAIDAINTRLHALAGPNTTIFDTAPLLCDSNSAFVPPTFLTDYLHLNDAGYACLNQALVPLLQTVIGSAA